MCIAIAKKRGVNLPDEKILYTCFFNNPHGAGFTYNRNGINHIKKGFMTFDEFMDALTKANIQRDESALIHFRVASVGKINQGNCHPFPAINNFKNMRSSCFSTNKCVVVHNGTFWNIAEDQHGNSDTMQFVNMVAPLLNEYSKMSNEIKRSISELLENFVDENFSRVAIMNNGGKIVCIGDWIKDKESGLMYSNKSYQAISSRFSIIQLEFDFKD